MYNVHCPDHDSGRLPILGQQLLRWDIAVSLCYQQGAAKPFRWNNLRWSLLCLVNAQHILLANCTEFMDWKIVHT